MTEKQTNKKKSPTGLFISILYDWILQTQIHDDQWYTHTLIDCHHQKKKNFIIVFIIEEEKKKRRVDDVIYNDQQSKIRRRNVYLYMYICSRRKNWSMGSKYKKINNRWENSLSGTLIEWCVCVCVCLTNRYSDGQCAVGKTKTKYIKPEKAESIEEQYKYLTRDVVCYSSKQTNRKWYIYICILHFSHTRTIIKVFSYFFKILSPGLICLALFYPSWMPISIGVRSSVFNG